MIQIASAHFLRLWFNAMSFLVLPSQERTRDRRTHRCRGAIVIQRSSFGWDPGYNFPNGNTNIVPKMENDWHSHATRFNRIELIGTAMRQQESLFHREEKHAGPVAPSTACSS
jgi:hypothetical protein